jgi:hypothetical protein
MPGVVEFTRAVLTPTIWTAFTISAGMSLGWLIAFVMRRIGRGVGVGGLIAAIPVPLWGALIACTAGGMFAAWRMGGRRGTSDPTIPVGFDPAFIESVLIYAAPVILTYGIAALGYMLAVGCLDTRIGGWLFFWSIVIEPLFHFDGIGNTFYWAISGREWGIAAGAAACIGIILGSGRLFSSLLRKQRGQPSQTPPLYAVGLRGEVLKYTLAFFMSALILGYLPLIPPFETLMIAFTRIRGALFHPDAARIALLPALMIALACLIVVRLARSSHRGTT